jgi:hypothetical protein
MGSDLSPLFPSFGKVLGKNLPTPVFRSIEIGTQPVGEEYAVHDLAISANLTISLTKPDNDKMNITELLENYFNDLYLYVYFSPFENVNTTLEEKRLNLRDLFDAYSDKDVTAHNFVGPGYGSTGGASDFPTSIYEYVIEFQKTSFLEKMFPSYFEPMTKTSDAEDTILGYTIDQARNLLENPTQDAISGIGVNPIYRLFWGYKGPAGRWIADTDIGTTALTGNFGGAGGWLESEGRGNPPSDRSWMRHTLEWTLTFLSRGGYEGGNSSWRHKIRLSDFASTDNDYGAIINENQEYDKEGNAIFKISNINTKTFLNTAHASTGDEFGSVTSRLNVLEKVFSIAFVGLDIEKIGTTTGPDDSRSDSYGWGVPYLDADTYTMEFGGTPGVYDMLPRRSLFNTYFGNIVYEHVLEKGKVVEKPTEAFYRVSDETQYDDVPIQALNSRYYVNEPVSRITIEKEMKKLIDSFELWRPSNESLDSNIKNLEHILETTKESPNIFMKFRDYMRTYSDKSPINHAGKFYSEFRSLSTQLVKSVMTQDRVTKKVFKNTVVYDARSTFSTGGVISTEYVAPYIYTEQEGFKAGREDNPFGDYIPTDWARYTSNVVFKRGAGAGFWGAAADKEDSEWFNIYYLFIAGLKGPIDHTVGGPGDPTPPAIEALLSAHDVSLLKPWQDAWAAEPPTVTEPEILAEAVRLTDNYFRYNSEYEILGIHDYAGGGGGWSASADHQGNRVVINDGWFFFDWEKALHTYSALAHFASPSAIQRFLGYRIPYENFPVLTAAVTRRGVNNNTEEAGHFIECRMGSEYNDYRGGTASSKYPYSAYSIASHTEDSDKFAIGSMLYHSPGGAAARDSEPTIQTESYLKFVNFDVVNRDIYTGLKTLRNFAPWTPEYPYAPIELGSRVGGDYRLMAYQFRDIMDDDVAYYNAIAGNIPDDEDTTAESNAKSALESINTEGVPFGQYLFYVAVEDKSLMVLKELYNSLVSPVGDRFGEYRERAEEMCSYNNIENKFNTFFANGMEEHYGVGTPPTLTTPAGPPEPQPPWFETPYLIAAFTMVLQRQYKSSDIKNYDLEQQVLDRAIIIAKQCNPRTGSLQGIEQVQLTLKKIEDMLLLQDENTFAKVHEILGDPHVYDAHTAATTYYYLSSRNYALTPHINAAGSAGFEFFPWSGGTLPAKCAYFLGSMIQDQPIFGDVMLDNEDLRLDIEEVITTTARHPPAGDLRSGYIYITAGQRENNYNDSESPDLNLYISASPYSGGDLVQRGIPAAFGGEDFDLLGFDNITARVGNFIGTTGYETGADAADEDDPYWDNLDLSPEDFAGTTSDRWYNLKPTGYGTWIWEKRSWADYDGDPGSQVATGEFHWPWLTHTPGGSWTLE